jgi:hypothetical protein
LMPKACIAWSIIQPGASSSDDDSAPYTTPR